MPHSALQKKRPFKEFQGVLYTSFQYMACRASKKLQGDVPEPSRCKPRVERTYLENVCGCDFCLLGETPVKSSEDPHCFQEAVPFWTAETA